MSLRWDFADQYGDLLHAAEIRRPLAPARALAGFAIAGLLLLLTRWPWLGLWATVYALAQGVEMWLLSPARLARWTRPSAARALAILLIFILPAAIYAPIAWPVWQEGGHYGQATAVMLLAGGGLNLITMSGGSFLAFIAPFSVYILVWLGAVLTDPQTDRTYKLVAALGAVVILINCLLTWRSSAAALAREKAAAAEIETRRAQAQAAVEAKSRLVATLGHELRTPISAIVAGADQLLRDADTAAARRHARMVGEAGAMMTDLLGDLLDLARLDAGALPIETIAFDLRSQIAQTLLLWQTEARRRGLRLGIAGARALPALVEGDPTRLRQILNNLLSNAIKFTPAGGVKVRLGYAADQLWVQVDDTGPGFAGVDRERLFAPYDQLGAAPRQGGSGLGLAISRGLARRMGGELSAGVAADGGGRMILVLPLTPIHPPRTARLQGARVLVADDHPLSRHALETMLSAMQLRPTGVASGEAALAAEQAFDLILLDLHMPGLNGAQTAIALRERPGPNRTVPIIAVTASDSEEDRQTCLAAGMAGPLIKPVAPDRLLALMRLSLG